MTQDIDFALVEEKRPPIYTAMKYWGKKPHNIWGKYIDTYTSEDGFALDPFSGSAMSAFEAVKNGRKGIAFDLNPLTSFIIEVYATVFDRESFFNSVDLIISKIQSDPVYIKYYSHSCPKCGSSDAFAQHFKWDDGNIYEIGVFCSRCRERSLVSPSKHQKQLSEEMFTINQPRWYPSDMFYKSPSFSSSFLKNIGSSNFSDLWTPRNLYILSFIFDEIIKENNRNLQLQLLFGFIQSLHLCSKMCVPRRTAANRDFSTSWGRSAYICSKRQMEMNPLFLFKNNCIGKQSVQSALEGVVSYLGKVPKIEYIDKDFKKNQSTTADIIYGVIDINHITDYIADESISFIITDPPYGGLVQYLDLSQIWLIWLKKYDLKYASDINAEITVKKGFFGLSDYSMRFTKGIKNLYQILEPDGKIVFTFHNKDLMIWNSFLRSLSEAGFKVEKVIHQQNRRTGESNVANPYGTSASDFYIRCSKSSYVEKIKTTRDEFENFIIDRAVSIIHARNEPTPYQILFNGLLSEISKAGFNLDQFDENINYFLEKHIGDIFVIVSNNELFGNLWWLKDEFTDSENTVALSERVDETVLTLFMNKKELTLDEVLAEIFIKYPNGLTPDIKSITSYIEKYAYRSGSKWVYKG
ncbi:hypothetical protein MmiHf6_16440 [Methanimicrococcus hongohii]|uniref:DNA methylase N-4/N-6 domain-containing protein n=1 Tax=Methanimicrococcus hongohii TaxID=3028295 RepID=A0AA96V1R8_9EURY|nr:hypothetical protein [Methanimicrococcus sp. Hf6]WNY24313.1 hypothetical protein MmiHf6_16440 [Methanimicrococcus sp. Hf6]